MRLEKHIATRFLTDDNFWLEIVESTHGKQTRESVANPKILSLYSLICNLGNKNYYCTETMLDKLDYLKVSKKGDQYDWTVFNCLDNRKVTFIFPNNCLLRMVIDGNIISFMHCKMDMYNANEGNCKWVMFYLNKVNGVTCEHFSHQDVQKIEEFVYKLLCFMYLTDNDEVVLQPKQKTGTKKSGKLINSLPFPLTIVNSRWNTTTISQYSFDVRGHFAIRWTGTGRTQAKLVFIEPFTKQGITRKAKKLDD